MAFHWLDWLPQGNKNGLQFAASDDRAVFRHVPSRLKTMKLSRSPSVEELQLVGRYESLRTILLGPQYREHLTKPLAYWALPSDRRLPLAFLGRRLDALLDAPFAELCATPGIGQKKIRSLVKLLARVANTDPAEVPASLSVLQESDRALPASPAWPNGFDPSAVSEVVWAQWRASVMRHGLGKEPLGRFATSLRHMTRVIWNKPLEAYAARSLAEIRAMRTHGEKRVVAILETFYGLHTLLAGMGVQEHLALRVVPRLLGAVETWVGRWLQTPGVPSQEEVFAEFIHPLLGQVRADAMPQIVHLAERRLGLCGPATSVRQVARLTGLTRARVYQLLNEIHDIMQVRWPLGRHQVYQLRDKFRAESAGLEQFQAAIELFYPGSRRGAAGPLERPFAENGEDPALADQAPAADEQEQRAMSRV